MLPTTRIATRALLLASALLIIGSSSALSQGIIVDREWRFGKVVLESSDVDVQIRDNVAHVSIDHVFRNTGNSVAEGIFLFPIPDGASIADFQMDMNGRLTSGEVLPAEEAKRIYQQIVQKNLDPALLEWVDGKSFRARIFPIAAKESQRIVLEYELLVDQVGNRFRFVHPLAGIVTTNPARPLPQWRVGPRSEERSPKSSSSTYGSYDEPDHRVAISITIDAGSKTQLRNVYSPSHEVDRDYKSESKATVALKSLNNENSNFVLYYSVDTDRISASLIPFRPYRDKPGYFMLMVAPPTKPDGENVEPKDIVFVLDTSGSMAGEKIEQAKSALRYALNRLGKNDSFGVVAFNSDLDVFSTRRVDPSRVPDALYFVDQIKARGGTNINAAVLKAIDLLKGAKNGSIVFLTDGLPSSGVTDIDTIISNVMDANDENATLFSFGVGYDVNTRLLGDLSESTSAFAEYVAPEENIEEVVSVFYERIRFPVMTDVSISIPDAGVFAMAPGDLPDLFVGDPLVITGRYRTSGKTTAILSGMVNGKKTELKYNIDFPAISRKESFVARTWATRRVGQLLSDIRRNGEDNELKEEVIALATEYGIVTPYSSYLITEDDERMANVLRTYTSGGTADQSAAMSPATTTGEMAVVASKQLNRLQQAAGYEKELNLGVQTGGQNFAKDEKGRWISSQAELKLDKDSEPAIKIQFASDAYFAFLKQYPEAKEYLRVGDDVTFVFRDQTVQIGKDGIARTSENELRKWFGS